MKSKIYLWVAIVLLAIPTAGCSEMSSNEPETPSLVGTWVYFYKNWDITIRTFCFEQDGSGSCKYVTYSPTPAGTYELDEHYHMDIFYEPNGKDAYTIYTYNGWGEKEEWGSIRHLTSVTFDTDFPGGCDVCRYIRSK